jgi:hypothetical protein
MTADVAYGAAWLLQVRVEGAALWVVGGLRDGATGDKGGPEEVFDCRGYGRT